jgi:hypothetical protein
MKSALLAGWVLLVPPYGAPLDASHEQKLRAWTVAGDAETKEDCERHRDISSAAMARTGAHEAAQRYRQAVCAEKSEVEALRRP